jgi:hypothetical protein
MFQQVLKLFQNRLGLHNDHGNAFFGLFLDRVTVIPAESHLSDVPPEMSSAQVMEYALFCPFENGIEGFSRIDMDMVPAELLGTVVDGIMSRVVLADRLVRMQLITHYMGLR